MWGQDRVCLYVCAVYRIIPTRVGTSVVPLCFQIGREDHPHACGDKLQNIKNRGGRIGSSPRVWGQESAEPLLVRLSGIIPTRVGTRVVIFCFLSPSWDHPHACGDKFALRPTICACSGSSPRVWGQDDDLLEFNKKWRIIPTRVGTSVDKDNNIVIGQDHPHACGDKCSAFSL